MIVRIWHGVSAAAKSDEYLGYLNETGVPDYRLTEGNLGVYVLRRFEDERAHERPSSCALKIPGSVRNLLDRSIVVQGVKTRRRRQEWTAELDPVAARLADGDPLAPRDLVERHYVELYRYAFSVLRDERAAEDAVQDAFERALGALGRYPEERLRAMRLRPWLYRITLNVARNRLRRRREVPVEEIFASCPEDDEGREGVMDVLAALGELPERQRVAVTLRYLQDQPYAEISGITGWPEGTVKTLVRRGLARLSRRLMIIDDAKGGDPA